ncbi:hypothetical protein [Zooshikella sp. RANM57]|uniref:hypothetical protein n=1 Tax=Zooshikella sp. RANM57 TaxID=3425863 RepID=UPI003D6F2344
MAGYFILVYLNDIEPMNKNDFPSITSIKKECQRLVDGLSKEVSGVYPFYNGIGLWFLEGITSGNALYLRDQLALASSNTFRKFAFLVIDSSDVGAHVTDKTEASRSQFTHYNSIRSLLTAFAK